MPKQVKQTTQKNPSAEGPKSIIKSLLEKGDSIKSKNKWWGKIILVVLAGLLIAGLVLRKRGMDKKRVQLIEEKNNAIADLKKQNRAMQEEKFGEKVNEIAAEIEIKKERVKEIKEELKTIGASDAQEKAAFDTISNWNTFNSYFGKS